MKIKEGGGVDIEKEREAFEEAMLRMTDGSFNTTKNNLTGQYTFGVNQTFWAVWQAAKAQAVPNLSELQERIAGHQYYHDEHGHMIVDMDDVVKEISSFDSYKAQAVPEWISVKDKLPKIGVYVMVFLEKQGHNPTTYNFCQYTKFGFHLSNVTHWMPLPDAPQEPAND